MGRLLQPLLVFLSAATDRDLARQIQFVKEENRILRSRLPKRINVTAAERRRLIKYGRHLKAAIKELITIVSPRTFARWLSGESAVSSKQSKRKPGRPATAADIQELVVRLASENGWGNTRIRDEMSKLGVTIARSTVIAILKKHGFDPGPKRGEGTWSEFIRRHRDTLWACDFFSKKVWTMRGLVDVFALFFIHVKTRRVHVAGMTTNPDNAWMVQQARNVSMHLADQVPPPKYLIMDMDTKFTARFRGIFKDEGIEVLRVGPHKPNLNAYAERFVQTMRKECLDHFVCFGVEHLRYICKQFKLFYNEQRPHQGLEGRTIPEGAAPATLAFPAAGEVVYKERLGGLLKHYYRQAA
jgi:putative transposase